MNRTMLAFLALMLALPGPRLLGGERGVPLLEEAFRQYSLKAGLLVRGEVLAAEVPCGDEVCLLLSLQKAPRDAVVRQLAQLASGFGYGATVEEMRVGSTRDNFLEVSISVVVRRDRRETTVEPLTRRAEELSAFLRLVARMSDAYREEFNPRKVAADRRLYFIDKFVVLEGGKRMSVRLLGPSEARTPERRGKASPGEAFRITVKRDGSVESGPFAGWQAFGVDWIRK